MGLQNSFYKICWEIFMLLSENMFVAFKTISLLIFWPNSQSIDRLSRHTSPVRRQRPGRSRPWSRRRPRGAAVGWCRAAARSRAGVEMIPRGLCSVAFGSLNECKDIARHLRFYVRFSIRVASGATRRRTRSIIFRQKLAECVPFNRFKATEKRSCARGCWRHRQNCPQRSRDWPSGMEDPETLEGGDKSRSSRKRSQRRRVRCVGQQWWHTPKIPNIMVFFGRNESVRSLGSKLSASGLGDTGSVDCWHTHEPFMISGSRTDAQKGDSSTHSNCSESILISMWRIHDQTKTKTGGVWRTSLNLR